MSAHNTQINLQTSTLYQTHQLLKRQLSFLYTNSRSLCNKIADFKARVDYEDPDIILIVETWLNKDYLNSELFSSQYEVYRKDRDGKVGGLLIAIKTTYVSKQLVTTDDVEILVVEICNTTTSKISLILGYIPNSNDRDYVQRFVNTASLLVQKCETFYIFGDLNFPHIDWNKLSLYGSASEKLIINFVIQHQPIYQLINFPTRGKNIIDVVFSNKLNSILKLMNAPPLGKSDHVVINGLIMVDNFHIASNKFCAEIQNFNKINIGQLTNTLYPNLAKMYLNRTAKVASDIFFSTIKNSIMCSVPQETILKKRMKTVPKELQAIYHKLKRHWHKWRKRKCSKDLEQYKIFRKVYKKALNSAKIAYEQNLVKSRNLKFLFKYIQSIKGSLRQDIKLQDSTGLIITEPTNIANILNNLFASKRNLNTISCVKPLILTEQSKVKISVDIFTNALIKIKKSNSVGPDKIPVTFWKHKTY